MAILRAGEIRKMGSKDREKKLLELSLELAKTKGSVSMGASAQSPGRIREIRKSIARIKTLETEIKRGEAASKKGETARK
jgi:large subunit ribosomal protein L29